MTEFDKEKDWAKVSSRESIKNIFLTFFKGTDRKL
jgi:hypothetical protein